MRRQAGFWDVEERHAQLSKAGDPPERLNGVVSFELFRPTLDKALKRSDRAKGGRPPHDAVMMFKVLVLQALYNLADDQTEFQIRDRLSFMRFLGLALHDVVPDAKSIWLYRELLSEAGAIDGLFQRLDDYLDGAGYLAMGGQIVDATLVAAPRQRNNDGEKAAIKAGKTASEIWPDKEAKAAQKDVDARWTVKFRKAKAAEDGQTQSRDIAIPVFGYKNHAGIDRKHGFIRGWEVTSAAAHDGAQLSTVLRRGNTCSAVWADTAYRSAKNEEWLEDNGFVSHIHHKKPKGKPMKASIRRGNHRRSQIRSRIEHVFARQKEGMGLFIRTIGLARARVKIGMANLAYNLTRLVWHERQRAAA